jgi:3-oxoacyl-[acyl-carrier protein] reductase
MKYESPPGRRSPWEVFLQISLADKKVIITGGVSGIGRALTVAFASSGAEVLATYLTNPEAPQFAAELQALGLKVKVAKLDSRDRVAVDQLFAQLDQEGWTPDVLVNNAGLVRDQLLLGMEDQEWRDVMATNLDGTFYVTRAAARMMVRRRRGAILNVSSVAASRPGRGQCNYAASKGAIETMTRALAVELAPKNIRVNAIAPGVIATKMSADVRDAAGDEILKTTLLKRFGTCEDVAQPAVFLCSDGAAFITGEVLHVDGGLKL